MSNEITKFYQFLSIQGQDWTKVADKEYGNSDGSLIKAEFKDYMNAEWNGEEMGLTLTDDLINKFWRKIDTNTSTDVIKGTNSIRNYNALDDKEVENLGKRIEAYQQFNEYVDMAVQSPGVFTSSDAEWRTAVIDELMLHLEDWINNGFQGDMAEYLEQFRTDIENKYTAEFCASEYQNELLQSVLKDYPDYKVGDDSTLTDLLENYVKNLESMEGTVDPETIKSDVRAIIDAYFATAGLGEGSGYDLSQVGYEPKEGDKLNDIQKEVLNAKLRENLADITSDENYEEFKALYDAAINAYIEETVSATKFGDFESVMNMGLEEFKETDAYKKLMVRIEASSIIGELEEGNDFYNAIVDTLGQSLADDLVIDHKFIGSAYDDIINEALNKCQNGEFMTEDGKIDKEALLEYVTTELAINLNSIYQNGYSDMPLKELNNLYDKLYDTAMNIADNEPETANTMIRDAAISYCDALVQKGSELENAVTEIFGDDYKTYLNDSNNRLSTIIEKMERLREAALKIGDIVDIADMNLGAAYENIIADSSLTYGGQSLEKASAVPSYYVANDGSIKFVNYGTTHGVFDDGENAELNNLFNNKIKNKIEETYAAEINTLKLSDSELDNIFNQALFLALSDRSVVLSMYDSASLSKIVEALCENYTTILTKISNDETAREYFKNVNGNSILAGRNTGTGTENGYTTNADVSKNLNKYYQEDSTAGGDDWTSIDSRGEESFSYGSASGSIIVLTIGSAGDRDPVNNAMKSILKDYIDSYSAYISADRIIELYRQAQETAFGNLDSTVSSTSASGSAIYGYGECGTHQEDNRWTWITGKTDTVNNQTDNMDTRKQDGSSVYYSVNSILINVIYEMEKLLSKEMMSA